MKLVPVSIRLTPSDTRAASALRPENENWIYDYYFVQYNSAGISLTSGHRRADVTIGSLEVEDEIWLYDATGCTLCLVANIRPYGQTLTVPGWAGEEYPDFPDNLPTFKTWKLDMAQHIAAAEAGTLKYMPMCGYWKGDVSGSTQANPTSITCTLGRMISRINMILTNSSGKTVKGLTMSNIATKAYLYPQVANTSLDASSDYRSIEDSFSLASGKSTIRYFYSSPNYTTGDQMATTLTVNNKSLKLGDNVEDGDYNLYMNTIYAFSITLK